MPYKNIVFIKLEKRLLNDHRWYMMSDHAQLLYIKVILLAAETYNKIPKSDDVLMQALRSSLEIGMFKGAMQEIKTNFPKFKSNKHFYYFDEFEHKTNYIPNKEIPRKSQGLPKVVVDKEEEEEEEEEEEDKIKREEREKIPPELEQVRLYCQERKNGVDANAWYNHYTAKGWLIGKNKMKDWQAAVRTWEKTDIKPKDPMEDYK